MNIRLKSVPETIRQIPAHMAGEHPLDLYARAFADCQVKATPWVNAGADSVVIELENGTVLKIGRKRLSPEMGSRPYDCPILEQGSITVEGDGIVEGGTVHWFIQPLCDDDWWAWGDFLEPVREDLKRHGYTLWDVSPKNFGRLNGKVVVIDPWAVKSAAAEPAA